MEKIEQLKERLFMLKMQDHWDSSDYKYADELERKIRRLEERNNGKR